MKRIAFLSLIAILVPAGSAWSQPKRSPAKTITPLVAGNAVTVMRIQMSAVHLDKQIKLLNDSLGDIQPVREFYISLRGIVGQLNKAGVEEVFIVAYVSQRPQEGFAFAVPVTANVDAQAVEAFFRRLRPPVLTKINGMIVAGGKNIAELAKQPAGKNADLEAAFQKVAGADVQAVVVFGNIGRQAIRESTPKQLPPALGGYKTAELLEAFQWAAVGVKLQPQLSIRAAVQAGDAQAAQKLLAFGTKVTAFAQEQPSAQWLNLLMGTYQTMAPKVVGNQIIGQADQKQLVQYLRKLAAPLRGVNLRRQSQNNLKQLALAMHNYHDSYGKFPAVANYNAQGTPLLSWRVHILPLLGGKYAKLHKEFRLNEPWNSAHNQKLIAKIPDVYRSPLSKAKPGRTTYLAPVGPNTVFGKKQRTIIQVATNDGTSNTVFLVEADDGSAVPWTQPADLPVDLKKPHRGLGNNPQKTFHAALVDGSVHSISRTIAAETLRRLFQYNDGKPVELP